MDQLGSTALSVVAAGRYGIRVEGDVDAVAERVVDDGEHLAGAALVGLEVHRGVGQVEGAAGGAGDLDHLGVRLDRPGAVRAVVRAVVAAGSGDDPAQRHQLAVVGEHPGRIGQAAAHPERAFAQSLGEQA